MELYQSPETGLATFKQRVLTARGKCVAELAPPVWTEFPRMVHSATGDLVTQHLAALAAVLAYSASEIPGACRKRTASGGRF